MTGPVSVPIKYHLTARDLESIKHHEEMLDGLKKIAELSHNVWMGWTESRLDTVLEINRIAEKLIAKERGE